MPSLISTLSADNEYVLYEKQENHNIPKKSFIVKGGTGVTDKRTLIIPEGTVTYIDEKELEWLQNNVVFKTHVKNGFIKIVTKENVSEKSMEKIVSGDMKKADGGVQPKEEDFVNEGLPSPTTDPKAADQDVDSLKAKKK